VFSSSCLRLQPHPGFCLIPTALNRAARMSPKPREATLGAFLFKLPFGGVQPQGRPRGHSNRSGTDSSFLSLKIVSLNALPWPSLDRQREQNTPSGEPHSGIRTGSFIVG